MQMMAGCGQNLGGVRGNGVGKFHLADFQLAGTDIDHGRLLTHQTAGIKLAGPYDSDALLGVFGSSGDGRRGLGGIRHLPLRVAAFHRHIVGIAGFDGFGGDVRDGEFAEQLASVTAHIEAVGADPGFRLCGQDARPRILRIISAHQRFGSADRPTPVHQSRQIVADERKCHRHIDGRLLRVHDSDRGAVCGIALELLNVRHCTILLFVKPGDLLLL